MILVSACLLVWFLGTWAEAAGQPSFAKYHKLTGEEQKCYDGTQAGFYIDDRGSQDWIVYLQGGAYCAWASKCEDLRRQANHRWKFSSSTWDQEKMELAGILSPHPEDNPTFSSYNAIYVPYCSQDLWIGSTSLILSSKTKRVRVHFRGKNIFQGVIAELIGNYGMASAASIVLSGRSAGGVGVQQHKRWRQSLQAMPHGVPPSLFTPLSWRLVCAK